MVIIYGGIAIDEVDIYSMDEEISGNQAYTPTSSERRIRRNVYKHNLHELRPESRGNSVAGSASYAGSSVGGGSVSVASSSIGGGRRSRGGTRRRSSPKSATPPNGTLTKDTVLVIGGPTDTKASSDGKFDQHAPDDGLAVILSERAVGSSNESEVIPDVEAEAPATAAEDPVVARVEKEKKDDEYEVAANDEEAATVPPVAAAAAALAAVVGADAVTKETPPPETTNPGPFTAPPENDQFSELPVSRTAASNVEIYVDSFDESNNMIGGDCERGTGGKECGDEAIEVTRTLSEESTPAEPEPLPSGGTVDMDDDEESNILPVVTDSLRDLYAEELKSKWDHGNKKNKDSSDRSTPSVGELAAIGGVEATERAHRYCFGISWRGVPVLMWCLCIGFGIGVITWTTYSAITYDSEADPLVFPPYASVTPSASPTGSDFTSHQTEAPIVPPWRDNIDVPTSSPVAAVAPIGETQNASNVTSESDSSVSSPINNLNTTTSGADSTTTLITNTTNTTANATSEDSTNSTGGDNDDATTSPSVSDTNLITSGLIANNDTNETADLNATVADAPAGGATNDLTDDVDMSEVVANSTNSIYNSTVVATATNTNNDTVVVVASVGVFMYENGTTVTTADNSSNVSTTNANNPLDNASLVPSTYQTESSDSEDDEATSEPTASLDPPQAKEAEARWPIMTETKITEVPNASDGTKPAEFDVEATIAAVSANVHVDNVNLNAVENAPNVDIGAALSAAAALPKFSLRQQHNSAFGSMSSPKFGAVLAPNEIVGVGDSHQDEDEDDPIVAEEDDAKELPFADEDITFGSTGSSGSGAIRESIANDPTSHRGKRKKSKDKY